MTLKGRVFNLAITLYTKYRMPYEQTMQPKIDFD